MEGHQQQEDSYKSETFKVLTSMGYNYLLAEIAYQSAPIKTVEGVINYIDANPNLHTRVEEEVRAKEAMIQTEADTDKKYRQVQQESYEQEAYKKLPNVGFIDPVLKQKLLLMGYEEYLIAAGLYATNSTSIDAAVCWIIDEGYKIPNPNPVYSPQKTESQPKNQPKVTPKITIDSQPKSNRVGGGYNYDAKASIDKEKQKVAQEKEDQAMKRKIEEQRIRANMERIQKAQKAKKDAQKAKVQNKVTADDLDSEIPKTIPEKFKLIFEKMCKIYPPKTEDGDKLKTCLTTINIYLSKNFTLRI